MNSGLTTLDQQKARLVARCNVERAVVAATCDQLQQSMTWWDLGYSVASTFAPRAKFLLPALAVAAGSSLGTYGRVGSVVSKLIAGWQLFRKAKSLYETVDLNSLLGRLPR
jgi:hypothetical protein